MLGYRYWGDERKLMFEVTEINFEKGHIRAQKHINGRGTSFITRDIHDKNIMSSTGYKDKNGTEVFFDDIVKVCLNMYGKDEWNYQGVVKYVRGTVIVADIIDMTHKYPIDHSKRLSWRPLANFFIEEEHEYVSNWGQAVKRYSSSLETLEVIGNIHTTPELMK